MLFGGGGGGGDESPGVDLFGTSPTVSHSR